MDNFNKKIYIEHLRVRARTKKEEIKKLKTRIENIISILQIKKCPLNRTTLQHELEIAKLDMMDKKQEIYKINENIIRLSFG